MQTIVFQNGIILLDCGSEIEIYERGHYGYNTETVVSQS